MLVSAVDEILGTHTCSMPGGCWALTRPRPGMRCSARLLTSEGAAEAVREPRWEPSRRTTFP
jgi:hypothetical protein